MILSFLIIADKIQGIKTLSGLYDTGSSIAQDGQNALRKRIWRGTIEEKWKCVLP